MNKRTAALAFVAVLAMCFAALMVAEGSYALDDNDFRITVPGTGAPEQTISIEMSNGESSTFSIYIVNYSAYYLDVSYSASAPNSDVSISKVPENTILYPQGSTEGSSVARDSFTITTEDVAGSHDSVVAFLYVTITDINDNISVKKTLTLDVDVTSSYDTSEYYNKFLGFIENNLPAPLDNPIVPCVVTIVFWLVVAEVLCLIFAPRLARFLDKRTTDDDAERFEKIISKLICILVFVITLNTGLEIMGADAQLIADAEIVSSMIYVVVGLILCWKVYLLVAEGILSRFEAMDEDSSIDMTLMPLCRMLGKLVFWVAGVAIVLALVGIDLSGILISAGVVTLGITMGAQNILSQFFSGIVLLTTRPFKKGDFLRMNDKIYVVKRVKIMFTEFMGWDKDVIITMPNNAVTAATITNLSKDDEAYRLYVYFEVAYKTDLKKAEEVMLKVANESPVVMHDEEHAAPNVRLTDFKDSGIELRLGVTVLDFNGSITAASSLRMAVYQAFLENDIEVPYDRLEVTMLNDCFSGERKPGDNVAD